MTAPMMGSGDPAEYKFRSPPELVEATQGPEGDWTLRYSDGTTAVVDGAAYANVFHEEHG